MTGNTLSDQGRILILEPGRADRHYWRDLWASHRLTLGSPLRVAR